MPTVADVENLRQKRFYAKATQTSAVVTAQHQPISPQKTENAARKRSRFPSGDQETLVKRVKGVEPGHKIYAQYTDVLLQPELLKEIKGHEGNRQKKAVKKSRT